MGAIPRRIKGVSTRALLTGGTLALLALQLFVAFSVDQPTIWGDEPGYLGNTHHLLYGTGATADGYYPGYSVVLIPAQLLSSDPLSFFRLALVTNALLAASVLPLLFWLIKRLVPRARDTEAFVAAGITSLIPALLVFPGFAMSGALTMPLFIGIALALHRAVESDRWRAWLVPGSLIGFLTWVNPRGFYVVIGFVVALLWACRPLRSRWTSIAAGVGSAVLVGGFGRMLISTLPGSGTTRGASQGIIRPLLDSLDLDGLTQTLSRASGSALYLGIATFGTVFVGLFMLGRMIVHRGRGDMARATTAAFVLTSFAATWLLTSARDIFPLYARWDYLVYGRYLENLVAPVMAVGLAYLVVRPVDALQVRVRNSSWIVLPPLLVVLAFVTERLAPPLVDDAIVAWVNVLSLRIYADALDTRTLLAFALAGGAVGAVVLWVLRRDQRAGSLLAAALAVLSGYWALDQFVVPEAETWAEYDELVEVVQSLDAEGVDTSCIAHETPDIARFGLLSNYKFRLPDSDFVEVDPRSGEAPCELLIGGRENVWAGHPDAVEIGTEPGDRPWTLFQLPEE